MVPSWTKCLREDPSFSTPPLVLVIPTTMSNIPHAGKICCTLTMCKVQHICLKIKALCLIGAKWLKRGPSIGGKNAVADPYPQWMEVLLSYMSPPSFENSSVSFEDSIFNVECTRNVCRRTNEGGHGVDWGVDRGSSQVENNELVAEELVEEDNVVDQVALLMVLVVEDNDHQKSFPIFTRFLNR